MPSVVTLAHFAEAGDEVMTQPAARKPRNPRLDSRRSEPASKRFRSLADLVRIVEHPVMELLVGKTFRQPLEEETLLRKTRM